MKLEKDKIFCFYCNKWLNIYTEIFLNVLYENSITCDEDHLVGNQSDKEWINFFKLKMEDKNEKD